MQSGVLGVHGHDLRAGRFRQRGDQLAADHERLLVGQREVDALAERRHGGPEAGGADECVEHQIGARLDDQPHEPLGAVQHLAPGPRLGGARGGVGLHQRDPPHAVGMGLLEQRLPRVLGGEPDQLELIGARHDVERLRADRAGGSEDQESLGHRREGSGTAARPS